jgi:transcriptional regulator with PAS, ATPase and Fis domain
VEQGAFRQDLFYRINVIPITVPPLRDRVGDIALLAESFFRRIQLKSDKKIQGITREAMELLMTYIWPGNVRELRSAFEYAVVTCQESMIQPNHFPPAVYQKPKPLKIRKNVPLNQVEIKKEQLIEALEKAQGNQSRAADILGISRVTVWNRMKKYGIAAQKKIIS